MDLGDLMFPAVLMGPAALIDLLLPSDEFMKTTMEMDSCE